jgi:hypothetical protein
MEITRPFPHIWIPKPPTLEEIRTYMAGRSPMASMFPGQVRGSTVIDPLTTALEWWDPDLGAFQDAGKTTPATANTNPVAVLTGQIGSYGDLSNAGGSARPTLVTGAVNGHSALAFTAVAMQLKRTSAKAYPFHFVCAVKTVTWAFGTALIWDGNAAGFLLWHAGSGQSPGLKLQNNIASSTNDSGLGLATWGTVSGVMTLNGTSTMKINTGSRDTFTGGTGSTNNGFATGNGGSVIAGFGSFQIGRIAMWGDAPNNTDEDARIAAFRTYYGL